METPSQDWIVKTVRAPTRPQNHGWYITPKTVADELNSNQKSSRPTGK